MRSGFAPKGRGDSRSVRRFDLDAVRAIPIRSVAVDLGFVLTATGLGRCRLPGHDDHNPSFSLNDAKQRFKCFACGERGDVIKLARLMTGRDFVETCAWMTDRYLGGAPERPRLPALISGNKAMSTPRDPVRASERAYRPDPELYGWFLERSPLEAGGTHYLRKRGFDASTIAHFRVGQVGDDRQALRELVTAFGRGRLEACGLLIPDSRGDRLVFRGGQLLFPFLDDDAVTYLQARLASEGTAFRWICPGGLAPPVFNQNALSHPAATIAICEGVTDVLSAHQLGYAAIGLVGASAPLPDEVVARLAGRMVEIFGDADKAGSRLASRMLDQLGRRGITTIQKRLPDGANDLNEYLRMKASR